MRQVVQEEHMIKSNAIIQTDKRCSGESENNEPVARDRVLLIVRFNSAFILSPWLLYYQFSTASGCGWVWRPRQPRILRSNKKAGDWHARVLQRVFSYVVYFKVREGQEQIDCHFQTNGDRDSVSESCCFWPWWALFENACVRACVRACFSRNTPWKCHCSCSLLVTEVSDEERTRNSAESDIAEASCQCAHWFDGMNVCMGGGRRDPGLQSPHSHHRLGLRQHHWRWPALRLKGTTRACRVWGCHPTAGKKRRHFDPGEWVEESRQEEITLYDLNIFFWCLMTSSC